jgi:smad nuclear-interacting protein 1
MGLSGKLAAETNKTVDGSAVLKYQPPPEARVCKRPVWQLFCFKGKEEVGKPINLNQTPFYLFGKDRKVADIPTDHPSCSRQHAVLVFRCVGCGQVAAVFVSFARCSSDYQPWNIDDTLLLRAGRMRGLHL